MWDLDRFDNRIALIEDNGVSLSYAGLADIRDRLSEKIDHRTLVVSLCQNSIGSIAGYVSFLELKIVPMMLSAGLERDFLSNLLANYCPEYIWMPTEMCAEDMFSGMDVVCSEFDYSLVKTGYDKTYPMYDELALLLTTSGSTGSPKFVRQSYTNICANTKSIIEYLELDETEGPITTLPMNYTYGLSIINTHLMVGATILVTDKSLMQKEFWSFFKDQKATSFGGVPYTYEMLNRLRFMRMDLPELRTMTQAGGKLSTDLHGKFAEYAADKGKRFIVMYGQCEATARMGYLPADKAVDKCGSMGVVIPGGEFSLIDEAGNLIDKPYVAGELLYKGDNVTLGYAENGDDLAKGDERGGVLATGDMAQFDEDGYYYIVGRKKRFLKIYGNRVNLDEIDQLLKGRFTDTECVAAGVDDHMYIFTADEAMSDEIKSFVVEKTKLNPAAFKVIGIDEIPKNEAGKTLYRELEKYYG